MMTRLRALWCWFVHAGSGVRVVYDQQGKCSLYCKRCGRKVWAS